MLFFLSSILYPTWNAIMSLARTNQIVLMKALDVALAEDCVRDCVRVCVCVRMP